MGELGFIYSVLLFIFVVCFVSYLSFLLFIKTNKQSFNLSYLLSEKALFIERLEIIKGFIRRI